MGTKSTLTFASVKEARRFLQERCPRVLEFASDEQVDAFAKRTCYRCIGEAARRYSAAWKPEADAVSWISERSLFENRFHTIRALATSMLGLSIFDQAKSADLPYSEVRRKAERLWPLWAR